MASIQKAVDFMVRIANDDTHGYDQTNRNGPDYDCSSLVATALYNAGFDVKPSSWTGNLEEQLHKCGFDDCSKPWKAGDIHLSTWNHVNMSISESQIAEATINEKGTVSGGQTGDQTGNEIRIANYYEYSSGWDKHLRYYGKNEEETSGDTLYVIAKDVIRGKYGNGVERTANLLKAGYDPEVVQGYVNKMLSGKCKTVEDVAREVIAGKWGVGVRRKKSLESAGYSYADVQTMVNRMLS